MTTGIAGAFNTAFQGVAAQLMTPETQTAITTFMSNVVTAFKHWPRRRPRSPKRWRNSCRSVRRSCRRSQAR